MKLKPYEGLIKLHDNRTFWKINTNIDDEEFCFQLECIIDEFKEITSVNIDLLGRSGRHICVENTSRNRQQYYNLRNCALRFERNLIKRMNEEN